ncbi:MAG: SDR family NAD(P)-dependent oxidoreductase [Candidatus Eremiobacteraeota bacterium]|nr:SDR family NAD(P)-dependent oxidoreductase [Candidatus Eremiobacteraeota bacterium]
MSLHYVITGAESGIGLSFCRRALQDGHRVTALCYADSSSLAGTGARIVDGYDVRLAPPIPELGMIDRLVLCAGVFKPDSVGAWDFESMLEHFQVNTLGPLRVVQRCQPHISKGGRIAILSSCWGSLTENEGGFYAYRASKTALNAAAVSLAHDLREEEVVVVLLHPGFVSTNLTGFRGKLTPEESVEQLFGLIETVEAKDSGVFLDYHGQMVPW